LYAGFSNNPSGVAVHVTPNSVTFYTEFRVFCKDVLNAIVSTEEVWVSMTMYLHLFSYIAPEWYPSTATQNLWSAPNRFWIGVTKCKSIPPKKSSSLYKWMPNISLVYIAKNGKNKWVISQYIVCTVDLPRQGIFETIRKSKGHIWELFGKMGYFWNGNLLGGIFGTEGSILDINSEKKGYLSLLEIINLPSVPSSQVSAVGYSMLPTLWQCTVWNFIIRIL
jgi:hypothetical protein